MTTPQNPLSTADIRHAQKLLHELKEYSELLRVTSIAVTQFARNQGRADCKGCALIQRALTKLVTDEPGVEA